MMGTARWSKSPCQGTLVAMLWISRASLTFRQNNIKTQIRPPLGPNCSTTQAGVDAPIPSTAMASCYHSNALWP
ncbi:hypothetical protein BJX62DRAFT_207532 [Aspergillus germanicus]